MRIKPYLPITISELFEIFKKSEIPSHDKKINAFVTDSREVGKDDVFIALEGEHDSGERYCPDAKRAGAFIIAQNKEYADIHVSDTSIAILEIAKHQLSKYQYLKDRIAITGSVGKTTTKNIISDMLSSKYRVHKTHKNYNNYLGVFHTVLTMPKNTEVLITETGMNHKGELSILSRAIIPTVSIITNVGHAHIGNFENRESIAKAKLEILEGMKGKKIILPKDEPLFEHIATKTTASAKDEKADCSVIATTLTDEYSIANVAFPGSILLQKRINVSGQHVLSSVAFGVALMSIMGCSRYEIDAAIDNIKSDTIENKFIHIGKLTFYDDTYSSSPEAIVADLRMLTLNKSKKISCVLGDMLELGKYADQLHREIGKIVAEFNVDKLFTFGELAENIAIGAMDHGMSNIKIFRNKNNKRPDITAMQIRLMCNEDEIILCKASHSQHAEKILEILKETERQRQA